MQMTRRQFLGWTLLAGAALALGVPGRRAGEVRARMRPPLRRLDEAAVAQTGGWSG